MLALKRISLVALFALLYPVLSWAQSLGYANPEDVGFSQERLDRIADTINTDIAKGIIPGGTLMIARDGKIAYYTPTHRRPGRNSLCFSDWQILLGA
jgi:CubicO group peptidase (beta-lactamase class C family)